MSQKGTVYLIHFDTPYRHARHYMGWTFDLQHRLDAHASGEGARLMAVVTAAGITWQLVRTWEGTRCDERKFKRSGTLARLCPHCRPAYLARKIALLALRTAARAQSAPERASVTDHLDGYPERAA